MVWNRGVSIASNLKRSWSRAQSTKHRLTRFASAVALVTATAGLGLVATGETVSAAVSSPAVTSITPNTGGTAGGTIVTIAGTNLEGATLVDFGAGANASSIDANLQPGGTIAGNVNNAQGTELANICILASNATNPALSPVETASGTNGAYSITGLAPGDYSVSFSGCQNPSDFETQTVGSVEVIANQTRSGIDATLTADTGGMIAGTVSDSSGVGLPGICVNAFDRTIGSSEAATTDNGGNFTINGLATGSYTVGFEACQGGTNYAPVTDTSVGVVAGQTTSQDAIMEPGGTISGTVQDGAGTGVAGICVVAFGAAGVASSPGPSASDGTYSITGLAAGTYTVQFNGCTDVNYVATANSAVEVGINQTTTLNVEMVPGASISGTVADGAGNGLANICATASNVSGFGFGQTSTTAQGGYSILGLATGSYQVSFESCGNPGNYAPLTYSTSVSVIAAAATYTVNSATSITATSPAESAGTVSVTVSTPAGTSATSNADQFTYGAPTTSPTVTGLAPTSGSTSGGTSVAIAGTGFTGATAVDFGNKSATTYTVNSATSITATSPAESAGTVSVTVSTPAGTSATSNADQFTYLAPVTPPAVPSGPATSSILSGYTPLSPARICDTRAGNPSNLSGAEAQCDSSPLTANVPLDVNVAGLAGVPATGVSGVMLNVTVTGPTSDGYLSVYPADQPVPSGSNLNFTKGQTVANAVEVGLSASGQIALVTNAALVNVVIDVEGYVATPAIAGTGLYNGVGPTRICDTRTGTGAANQCTGKTMGPGSTLTVQVAGLAGVSTNASAVALNVTVTNTTGAGGYLTVFPSGVPPTASNLNWAGGETVANLVVTALNSGGGINLYNYAGSADVIVDVLGYYTGAGGSGAQFTALGEPTRICDTRDSGSANQCTGRTMSGNSTMTVQVTGLAGVPAAATAVVINVTATNTTSNGYLTVYQSGIRPLASNLNWAVGTTVPNLVIATLSSGGAITIYNSAGSTDIVIDVLGYYQ